MLPPGHALDFAFQQSATYLAVDPAIGAAALSTGGGLSNDRFHVVATGLDGGRDPQNPEAGAASAYWQMQFRKGVAGVF